MNDANKVQPSHIQRAAFVYIRQSSPAQVEFNRESTARQYALVEKACHSRVERLFQLAVSHCTANFRSKFLHSPEATWQGNPFVIVPHRYAHCRLSSVVKTVVTTRRYGVLRRATLIWP